MKKLLLIFAISTISISISALPIKQQLLENLQHAKAALKNKDFKAAATDINNAFNNASAISSAGQLNLQPAYYQALAAEKMTGAKLEEQIKKIDANIRAAISNVNSNMETL